MPFKFPDSVVDFELLTPFKWFLVFMKHFSTDPKYDRSLFLVILEILSLSLFRCSGRVELSNWEVRLSSRKTMLTCSLLPSISCIFSSNTLSSPTKSARTIHYATLPLKMIDSITLAPKASSISYMAPWQSQLKCINKKCFKLSRFCPRFLLFIFSRHNTTFFKSDNIIIFLLTLLWPFHTKSEMIINSSRIHMLFQIFSMPFGMFLSGSFFIAPLPVLFILEKCVFFPIWFILESGVFLPIRYRLESC